MPMWITRDEDCELYVWKRMPHYVAPTEKSYGHWFAHKAALDLDNEEVAWLCRAIGVPLPKSCHRVKVPRVDKTKCEVM